MQIQQPQAKKQTVIQITAIEKEILAAYRQAQKDITADIAKFYGKVLEGVDPADYYNAAIKGSRFDALDKEITKRYKQASLAAGRGVIQSSSLGMSNVYYKNQYISDFFAPTAGIDLDFSALPPELLEMAVMGFYEFLISEYTD